MSVGSSQALQHGCLPIPNKLQIRSLNSQRLLSVGLFPFSSLILQPHTLGPKQRKKINDRALHCKAAVSSDSQSTTRSAPHGATGTSQPQPVGVVVEYVEPSGEVTVEEMVASTSRADSSSLQNAGVVEVYQSVPGPSSRPIIPANRLVRGGLLAVAAFLVGTFVVAVFKVVVTYNSKEAVSARNKGKNQVAVTTVQQLLDEGGRQTLTPQSMRSLRGKTGFSNVELFRKYLWFLLRERKFDQAAVDDMVALKQALQLSNEQVAEALAERGRRVYQRYGTLMLNTAGMTEAGVQRKATCRALFSKLLFLAEYSLLTGDEGAKLVDLPGIFGATSDDMSRLRIVSLYEVDFGRLEDMPTTSEGFDSR